MRARSKGISVCHNTLSGLSTPMRHLNTATCSSLPRVGRYTRLTTSVVRHIGAVAEVTRLGKSGHPCLNPLRNDRVLSGDGTSSQAAAVCS